MRPIKVTDGKVTLAANPHLPLLPVFSDFYDELGQDEFEKLVTAVMLYADVNTGLAAYSDDERLRAAKRIYPGLHLRRHGRLIKAYRAHAMSPLANLMRDMLDTARSMMSNVAKMDLASSSVDDMRKAMDILKGLPDVIERIEITYKRLITEQSDDSGSRTVESGLEQM